MKFLLFLFLIFYFKSSNAGKVGEAFESLAGMALNDDGSESKQMSSEEFSEKMHTLTDLTSNLFAKMMQLVPHSENVHPPEIEVKTYSSDDGAGRKAPSLVSSIVDSIGGIPFNMNAADTHGEHVCVREINRALPPDAEGVSTLKKCFRYTNARKCVNRRITPAGGRETIRLYECCQGYTTKDIMEDGCRLERSNDSTLSLLNSDSEGQVTAISYQNTVLYTLPGIQHVFDWEDGQNLTTKTGDTIYVSQLPTSNGLIETRLNCVPVVNSIEGTGGIVHEVSDPMIHSAHRNLMDIISKDSRFTIYKSLLDESLQDALSDSSKLFTIFAFTNEAFEVLSKDIKSQIMSKEGCVTDLIKGLILRGGHCSRELHTQRAIDGNQLAITNSMTKIAVMGSKIVDKDFVAENGVLHVIDEIPLREEFLSWKNTLRLYNEDLFEIVDKFPEARLPIPLTIFIPENNSTVEMTPEMALNQIAPGYVHLSSSRNKITTLGNSSLFISSPPSSPFSFRMSGTLLPADSLRIGCVTAFHFTTETIEQYLSQNPEFSKFYNLWAESTISERLANHPAITVFAPTNDAFSNNFYRRLQNDPQALDIFVGRHIVTEAICESDLRRSADEIRLQVFQNLNGEALHPTQNGAKQIVLSGTIIEDPPKLLKDGLIYRLEAIIDKEYREIRPNWRQRHRSFGNPTSLLDYLFNSKKA
ncbi:hypothetical protein WR25_08243 [Diploscapter pachys]|uniref:FAS1 domain-containing protein n=1 Tax=Diploscapter pachys TaxID=2018661 RepID=A0A2A2LHJ7_9BILA|nr:hypothetical protein WR25_08243 [Diploscapter pachys]